MHGYKCRTRQLKQEVSGSRGSLSETLQTEIQIIWADTEQTTRLFHAFNARVNDAENRSKQNNLVFYGLPDTAASETSTTSKEKIIRLCSDHLDVPLEPQDIEQAHRVGRYSANRRCPLIVRLNHYKKKEMILSNGCKRKGTDPSISEDFSPAVFFSPAGNLFLLRKLNLCRFPCTSKLSSLVLRGTCSMTRRKQ